MAQVIIVVDDDGVSREWAKYVHLGRPVLVTTMDEAPRLIKQLGRRIHAILINDQDYERAFWIASLTSYFCEGNLYVAGIVSADLTDSFSRLTLVVNGTPVILYKQDEFILEGKVINWAAVYDQLTRRGPILATMRE